MKGENLSNMHLNYLSNLFHMYLMKHLHGWSQSEYVVSSPRINHQKKSDALKLPRMQYKVGCTIRWPSDGPEKRSPVAVRGEPIARGFGKPRGTQLAMTLTF